MDWSLEVIVLPVSDIDRSIVFYRDQVGFKLDHHTQNEHMNVAQLTPPGSGCSIVFGDLPSQNQMAPGSMKALQLVVPDATAARQELLDLASGERAQRGHRGGRRHVLRLSRPGRQLMGSAGDQGSSRQAADPQRSHRTQRMGWPWRLRSSVRCSSALSDRRFVLRPAIATTSITNATRSRRSATAGICGREPLPTILGSHS